MNDFTHNRGSHWKPRGMLFNLRISEKLLQTNKKCGFTNQLKGGIAPGGKGDNITDPRHAKIDAFCISYVEYCWINIDTGSKTQKWFCFNIWNFIPWHGFQHLSSYIFCNEKCSCPQSQRCPSAVHSYATLPPRKAFQFAQQDNGSYIPVCTCDRPKKGWSWK